MASRLRFITTTSCCLPSTAKAQELLKSQYAAVGAAADAALPAVLLSIQQAASRLDGDESRSLESLLTDFQHRKESAAKFVAAYRNYCWPVESLNDFKLAQFHLLVTEDRVHVGQNHKWHLEALARVCAHDPHLLLATPHRLGDVTDPAQVIEHLPGGPTLLSVAAKGW